MLDPGVLMRRAVRWVCEQNNLKPDSLAQFDHQTQEHFRDLSLAVADHMRYNQLEYFRPFDLTLTSKNTFVPK